MPSFDFNPKDASAGIQVYPKGTYEVELGEPKTFYRAGKNNKADNFGVQFVGKIIEAEDSKFKGKKYFVSCFMHTPESRDMTKQIQMAALGFTKKQEEQFDAEYGTQDWRFNTDTNTVGDGWQLMKGQVVVYDLDVGINAETGEEQQKTVGIRPLVSVASN